MQFNWIELSTLGDAVWSAKKMSSGPIIVGGGVRPVTYLPGTTQINHATSGIYLPVWTAGPHGDPEPYGKDSAGHPTYWFHYRYNNGGEGMNCGLVERMFDRFPNSKAYVLSFLAEEAKHLQGAALQLEHLRRLRHMALAA